MDRNESTMIRHYRESVRRFDAKACAVRVWKDVWEITIAGYGEIRANTEREAWRNAAWYLEADRLI